MQYAWKDGWLFNVDAQVAGDELARIREKHGKITATLVVEESRRKRAPLHDAIFHCDEKEAARIHYEDRARGIIRAVFIIKPPDDEPSIRAFQFVVKNSDSAAYYPVEEVAAEPATAAQVRERLVKEMSRLKEEIKAWDEFASEFSGVVRALEEALAK